MEAVHGDASLVQASRELVREEDIGELRAVVGAERRVALREGEVVEVDRPTRLDLRRDDDDPRGSGRFDALAKTSIAGSFARISPATRRTSDWTARSAKKRSTAGLPARRAAASSFVASARSRATIARRAPFLASPRAVSRPIPEVAPVMRQTLPRTLHIGGEPTRKPSGQLRLPVSRPCSRRPS